MHVFPVSFEINEFPASVLVAQYSEELTIEALLEHLYNEFTSERLRASAIVIRPNVQDQFSPHDLMSAGGCERLRPSSFLEAIRDAIAAPRTQLGRFAHLPIHVLHAHNGELHISPNVNPLAAPSEPLDTYLHSGEALATIRDAEMRALVDRSRAYLPPIEGAYYLPPSNKPARSFLRVGNIQYSRQAIDAVTFWLLPHVLHADAILCDTWSLSSIALNVSRVLAALRGQSPVPVEMLSRYHDESEVSHAALLEILDRLAYAARRGEVSMEAGTALGADPPPFADRPLQIACLVSATQTGSLVSILEEQRAVSCLDAEFQFTALYRLGDAVELPSLCDMSKDEGFMKLDEEEIGERAPIPVDAQVYFPLSYITVELTPRVPHATPFRSFLELVKGKGILSVHRDQQSDGQLRHHGIHVDTGRLIVLPAFREQFRNKLLALSPTPELILTPLHDAADRLGTLAADMLEEKTGTRPRHVRHTSLELRDEGATAAADAEVKDALAAVPANSAILVLDDCYITGARLIGYHGRLRQLAVPARLQYLVALARPAKPTDWAEFQKRVGFRVPGDRQHHQDNSVHSVLNACLPNWLGPQCPWCREAAFYECAPAAADEEQDVEKTLPEFLAERQTRLADRDSGLTQDLFLAAPSSKAPLKLYPSSVFAPEDCNQAEVFISVAAALQQMRVAQGSGPALGPRHYPIATVIEAKNYLHEMYTDSIIRASILRGAALEELVYPNPTDEKSRSGMISLILSSPNVDVNDLAPELFLAHAAGKCAIDQGVEGEGLPDEMRWLLDHARIAYRRP